VDVASVSASLKHVLAVTFGGDVYSWGASELHFALGHRPPAPGDTAHGRLPKRIEALRGVRVRSVAAGYLHSCAVTHAGELYIWGRGCGGSERNGYPFGVRDEPVPRKKDTSYYGDADNFMVGVAAGREHTVLAGRDGLVYGFGSVRAIGQQVCDLDFNEDGDGLRMMTCMSLDDVATWK
jgi:alpha-tubulin suppressor-like RCC1 family protein